MQQPKKLRKKRPFHCRHKNLSGKLDHLDYVLAESDTDLCPQHEVEKKAAYDKFWNQPTVAHVNEDFEVVEPKPHWPFWPSDKDTAAQEVA